MSHGSVMEKVFEYNGHRRPISSVAYNSNSGSFFSTDDRQIRSWSITREICKNNMCSSQTIQTIEYIAQKKLFIASAYDGSLKVYNHDMQLLMSSFTNRGVILSLVFHTHKNIIFAGGVDGCSAWELKGREKDGDWIRNPQYQLCSKNAFHSNRKVWVNKIVLDEGRDRLYALWKTNLDVYDLSTGKIVQTYKSLCYISNSGITDILIHPVTHHIIYSSKEGEIFIVSEQPRSLVCTLKNHAKAVTSLAVHPTSGMLLSSSEDGTIRLWDMDTFQEAQRKDMGKPVLALQLLDNTNPVQFMCRTRSSIFIYSLAHTLRRHMIYGSPVTILEKITISSPRAFLLAKAKEVKQRDSQDEEKNSHPVVKCLIAVCLDKTIRILAGESLSTLAGVWISEDTIDMIGLTFNPITRHLYLLNRNKIIALTASEDTPPIKRLIDIEDYSLTCISVCYECPSIKSLQLKNSRKSTARCLSISQIKICSTAIENHHGNEWVVAGAATGDLIFWAWHHPDSLVNCIVVSAHQSKVINILHSMSMPILVTLGQAGDIKVWRTFPLWNSTHTIWLCNIPSCIKLSPTFELLIAGYDTGKIEIYDFQFNQARQLTSEDNHTDLVTAADFSDKLHIFVTTSLDGTIRIWDYNNTFLKEFNTATSFSSICFVNDKGDAFVGKDDGIYLISGDDLLPPKLPTEKLLRSLGAKCTLDDNVIKSEAKSNNLRSNAICCTLGSDAFDSSYAKIDSDEPILDNDPISIGPTSPKVALIKDCNIPVDLTSLLSNLQLKDVNDLTPPILHSALGPEKMKHNVKSPKIHQPSYSLPPIVLQFDSRFTDKEVSHSTDQIKQNSMYRKTQMAEASLSRSGRPMSFVNKVKKSDRARRNPERPPSNNNVSTIIPAEFSTTMSKKPRRPLTIWNAIGASDKRKIIIHRSSC